MNIKLLALDIDGTTICSDHTTVPPENLTAIDTLIDLGIHVVVATGRILHRLPAQIEAIPGIRYIISANGAAVTDKVTGKQLFSDPIPHALAARIFDALEDSGAYIEVYCNGDAYASAKDEALFDSFPLTPGRRALLSENRHIVENLRAFALQKGMVIEKMNMPFLPQNMQEEVLKRLHPFLKEISLTSSVKDNLEINGYGANKARGLQALCEHLHLSPSQVMAIGDNGNDLEMLEFAGISVCPANGAEEAKMRADFITASNDEAGVSIAIDKFILSPIRKLSHTSVL